MEETQVSAREPLMLSYIDRYGEDITLALYADHYQDGGGLALEALYVPDSVDDEGFLEPWSTLTVNLRDSPHSADWCHQHNHIILDTNNNPPELINALVDAGIVTLTDEGDCSGFCVYPYATVSPQALASLTGLEETVEGIFRLMDEHKDVAEHAPDPRSQGVRDWYMKTFPTDELGAEIDPDITFDGALSVVDKGPAFYDGLGVRDSLVRERVFMELSERYDIDYGDIYESWLNSKPLPDHALLKTALGEQVYEDMKAAMEPHIAEFEESLDEVLASMRESSSALDDGRGGKDSTVER